MDKDSSVPGNVLASQAIIQREAMKLALAVDRVDHKVHYDDDAPLWLTGMRVKFPVNEGGEYLVVMRGEEVDRGVVAFHAATSLREALRGAFERFMNGSLKWKTDEYRSGGK